jgi:ATP-dependent RNA helicase HelY
LSAGDFVRWCRQVLDLLDQVRNAAPTSALRTSAKRAIDAIRRGVVAVDAG